jgi:hypothetical protein
MKIQEQILVDRRRGRMQLEVQKFEGMIAVLMKNAWALKPKL